MDPEMNASSSDSLLYVIDIGRVSSRGSPFSAARAPAADEAGEMSPPNLLATPVLPLACSIDLRHAKYEGLA